MRCRSSGDLRGARTCHNLRAAHASCAIAGVTACVTSGVCPWLPLGSEGTELSPRVLRAFSPNPGAMQASERWKRPNRHERGFDARTSDAGGTGPGGGTHRPRGRARDIRPKAPKRAPEEPLRPAGPPWRPRPDHRVVPRRLRQGAAPGGQPRWSWTPTITKDLKVVVTHDRQISATKCRDTGPGDARRSDVPVRREVHQGPDPGPDQNHGLRLPAAARLPRAGADQGPPDGRAARTSSTW